MNKNIKVGVVIPVRNEEEKIIEAIESIALTNKARFYFVVVDDASDDNTVANVRALYEKHSLQGVVVENSPRQGAGTARNTGIDHLPDVDYVLFADADDRMCPGALDVLIGSGEKTGADVVLGKYRYFHGDNGEFRGMVKDDEKHWERVLNGDAAKTFQLSSYGAFLETVNYPWNKLLRFDFLKAIELRFSETPVHNDILAHWLILMSSYRIALVDHVVCEHRVYQRRAQITNISDGRRLALFKALEDVEDLFRKNAGWKRSYYHFFLRFKWDLARWAYGRLENEYKQEFMETYRRSLKDFDMLTYLGVAETSPDLAVNYAYLKFGMKSLE